MNGYEVGTTLNEKLMNDVNFNSTGYVNTTMKILVDLLKKSYKNCIVFKQQKISTGTIFLGKHRMLIIFTCFEYQSSCLSIQKTEQILCMGCWIIIMFCNFVILFRIILSNFCFVAFFRRKLFGNLIYYPCVHVYM